MKTKKLALAFILSLTFSNLSFAGNKVSCSYSSSIGGSGCFFGNMQMYDQNSDVSDGRNYCTPTSAAMALSALTFGGISYYAGSWTDNNFIGKSKEDRIEAFAFYLNTDVDDGTYWSGRKKFKKRDKDFRRATENYDLANYRKLSDSRMRTLVRRGEVDILSYGHYTENCTGTGSSKICTYSRNGGHSVALNGYYYTPGSSTYTTSIFDPSGGIEKHKDISYLSDRTTATGFLGWDLDYRTYGSKTYTLVRNSGSSYYGIIDDVVGVNSN